MQIQIFFNMSSMLLLFLKSKIQENLLFYALQKRPYNIIVQIHLYSFFPLPTMLYVDFSSFLRIILWDDNLEVGFELHNINIK